MTLIVRSCSYSYSCSLSFFFFLLSLFPLTKGRHENAASSHYLSLTSSSSSPPRLFPIFTSSSSRTRSSQCIDTKREKTWKKGEQEAAANEEEEELQRDEMEPSVKRVCLTPPSRTASCKMLKVQSLALRGTRDLWRIVLDFVSLSTHYSVSLVCRDLCQVAYSTPPRVQVEDIDWLRNISQTSLTHRWKRLSIVYPRLASLCSDYEIAAEYYYLFAEIRVMHYNISSSVTKSVYPLAYMRSKVRQCHLSVGYPGNRDIVPEWWNLGGCTILSLEAHTSTPTEMEALMMRLPFTLTKLHLYSDTPADKVRHPLRVDSPGWKRLLSLPLLTNLFIDSHCLWNDDLLNSLASLSLTELFLTSPVVEGEEEDEKIVTYDFPRLPLLSLRRLSLEDTRWWNEEMWQQCAQWSPNLTSILIEEMDSVPPLHLWPSLKNVVLTSDYSWNLDNSTPPPHFPPLTHLDLTGRGVDADSLVLDSRLLCRIVDTEVEDGSPDRVLDILLGMFLSIPPSWYPKRFSTLCTLRLPVNETVLDALFTAVDGHLPLSQLPHLSTLCLIDRNSSLSDSHILSILHHFPPTLHHLGLWSPHFTEKTWIPILHSTHLPRISILSHQRGAPLSTHCINMARRRGWSVYSIQH